MTPEQFAELIAEGDAAKIAEVTETLDESRRRKLWKGVSQIVKELRRVSNQSLYISTRFASVDALKMNLDEGLQRKMIACDVAALAVGALSQARSVIASWDNHSVDLCVKVLADRRPEWIDEWVENRLLLGLSSRHDWRLIRSLIRHGICRKPLSDSYIQWMARAALYPSKDDPRWLRDVLLDDREALEDVWRLFEVETFALCMPDDFRLMVGGESWSQSWPVSLAKLSQQGHINRDRLLDASLKALSSGLKDATLTYFVRFHEFLEPTLDETVFRQEMFLDLLANRASHVVTFALEKIGQIEKAGRLDGESFLGAMSPVFHFRSKGQSKTALDIAARMVHSRPELLPHAVAGVLEAFAHPAADVQEQAVGLIETWAPRLHPDHATTIRERLEELTPTIRSRAEKIVSQLRPAAEPTQRSADQEFGLKFEELARDAEALMSPWRERAGVDEALESLRAGRMPRPLEFDLLEARVLTGVAPIEPIQSVDELVDAVAHAVETMDSADELERILDGISRFCDRRPPDFQRRVDPVVKRMDDIHGAEFAMGDLTASDSVSESVYQLLMLWLCGKSSPSRYNPAALYKFFDGRVQELIERVRAGRARPLLAAPTHQGGWIDPGVFVQRLLGLVQSGDEPGTFDLIQAVLRLAPDGRQEALAAAGQLPGHVGRAVRWSLGGQEGPNPEDGSHTSSWLAAGRARYPTGTLGDLCVLTIGKDQPDAFVPARYVWKPRTREDADRWWRHKFPLIEMTIEPESPLGGVPSMWPTAALHERDERWKHVPGWQCCVLTMWRIGMICEIWPLCLDPVLVGGIYALGQRLDMPASTLEPNHAFLRPWLEPDRPWSELAYLAIWLALISKDADSRQMGLDVLIQAVGDGRANPTTMADVLARLIPGGWVKLNRVADALGETARVSPLHTWFAAETLQGLLSRLAQLPRDAHFILSLLRELLADLGMALSPTSQTCLETVEGTSKTAKAARALLNLKPGSEPGKLRVAAVQALEARIARARRWSGEGAVHG